MENEKNNPIQELRIQKYMSDCGVMSRRAAESEILAGRILINGKKAQIGQKITPGRDEVQYNGVTVMPQKRAQKLYIMLNKPKGYVTTLSDEMGRNCITELIEDVGTRVYPCGRLDMDSEGLLILTNDGDLANRLTHPMHSIPKIYHVKIRGELEAEQLRQLSGPMTIDGYEIMSVKCDIVTRKEGITVVRMELYEGRNRQIRKMCEQTGLEIITLKRIAVGQITLGDLRPGRWKPLTAAQARYLKGIKETSGK